jgi:putative sporulation protein YtaF
MYQQMFGVFCLTIQCVYQSLLLSASVCADTFAAAISYGAQKIAVPKISTILLSTVTAVVLTASTAAGRITAPAISPAAAKWLCFALLLAIGSLRLFDSALKSWIRRSAGRGEVKFTAFRLHFLLEIYADPQMADMDAGGELSPKEALLMALVLSLDGLAAGFGAGAGGVNLPLTGIFSLILGFTAVIFGTKMGKAATRHTKHDLSPIGGALMIALAISSLI